MAESYFLTNNDNKIYPVSHADICYLNKEKFKHNDGSAMTAGELLEDLANGTDDVESLYIKTVPNGARCADMTMLGGMSRKGKNLLNGTLATTTTNGITCTNNGDGTFTLNGTATADISFNDKFSLPNMDITGKIVGCPSGGSNTTYDMFAWDYTANARCKTSSGSASSSDLGNGATDIVFPAGHSFTVGIRIRSGVTVTNLTYKPMLTTDTSLTYDDYEPYTDALIDGKVDKVVSVGNVPYAEHTTNISTTITDLCPDYGIGINEECYNYIDLENKVYHHKVIPAKIGDLTWSKSDSTDTNAYYSVLTGAKRAKYVSNVTIPNMLSPKFEAISAGNFYADKKGLMTIVSSTQDQSGSISIRFNVGLDGASTASDFVSTYGAEIVYYELATEETVDLSSVIDDDLEFIEVEGGGTLTFHAPSLDNGYAVDMPSNVHYTYGELGDTTIDIVKTKSDLSELEDEIDNLATVATSGSYTDLSNKPTIPTVDSAMSTTSTNPIQNKVVTNKLNEINNLSNAQLNLGYLGKNLLPNNATSMTRQGVTFTVNSDGSIKINGTGTATPIAVTLATKLTLKAGTYILSGINHSNNGGTIFYLQKDASDASTRVSFYKSSTTFTITEDTTYELANIRLQNLTYDNVIDYPMIRYADITDDTYVPYVPSNAELADEIDSLEATMVTQPKIVVTSSANYPSSPNSNTIYFVTD